MNQKKTESILRTHSKETSKLDQRIGELKNKLLSRGETAAGTLKEKMDLLDQLTEFEYGRFLIEHGGLNGQMSHYAFYEFPKQRAEGKKFHPLEERMMTTKGMESNRERYSLIRSLLEPELFEGIKILSVPCGMMTELLTLNFSAIEKYELVGCDLDTESVELAKSQAKARGVLEKTSFWQRDAWNLATEVEFDRVVSLGLNMYCEDRQSAISLYKSFWQALKPSGKLMVTYMTHTHGPNIERDLSLVSSDEKKLVAMMAEVLEIKYFNHLNSSAEIVENLKEAGFSEVSCHYSKFRALNIAVGVK